MNWLKTGTWDYYAPARRKLVRETLILKRKRSDDEIFADFKRRKAERKVDLSILKPGEGGPHNKRALACVKTRFLAGLRKRNSRNDD